MSELILLGPFTTQIIETFNFVDNVEYRIKIRADDQAHSMSYSQFFEQHKIMFEKKISVAATDNTIALNGRWNLYTSQKKIFYS